MGERSERVFTALLNLCIPIYPALVLRSLRHIWIFSRTGRGLFEIKNPQPLQPSIFHSVWARRVKSIKINQRSRLSVFVTVPFRRWELFHQPIKNSMQVRSVGSV